MKFAFLLTLLLIPACASFKIERKGIYEIYKSDRSVSSNQCTPMMLEKVWDVLIKEYYRELKPTYLWSLAIKGLVKGGGLPLVSKEALDHDKYIVKPTPEIAWQMVDFSAWALRLDRSRLCFAVIDGMTQGLDPYTNFTRPQDMESHMDRNYAETFGGVGIVLTAQAKPFRAFVDHVVLNSAAERAGIKRFDELILLDDTHIAKLTMIQIQQKLRGPVGTTLEISVKRQNRYIWFKIQRDKVDYKMAWCKVDEEKRAYCRLHGFKGSTAEELEDAINNLPPHKKEIIIDLRNNPGGLVFSATNIAAKFWLGHKRIAIFQKRKVGFVDFNDTSIDHPPLLSKYKTVFLSNHNTASASELLLAAIRDHGVAPIVGTSTYGKGVGQSLYLIDGGLLTCTSLWVLSPNGELIQGKGVAPQVEVDLGLEDFIAGNDIQLKKAYEVLRKWK